jgi:hypothetical protein
MIYLILAWFWLLPYSSPNFTLGVIMPQNTTITCPAGVWTLLTTNNAPALRVANMSTETIWLQGTVGTTPPTGASGLNGAIPVLPNQILAADLTLEHLFPGISGANRVYAFAPAPAILSVSHV